MRCGFGSDVKRGLRAERGAISVEFAILLPVFLLLVGGIMDFGHAFYIKQVVSNASREGARYGARYTTDSAGAHMLPNALNPSITAWVTSQYSSLVGDENLQVSPPTGAGYTSGIAGADLAVTVTATKRWWVVGSLMGGPTTDISSTTCMKVE